MRDIITVMQSFMGGMAKSISKFLIPNNKYVEAENVTILPQEDSTQGGLTPALGTEFSIVRETINIQNDADDYKGFRVQLDLGFNVPHLITYTIPSSPPVTLNISSTAITASLRYADLISQINADSFLDVYITPALTSNTVGYVGVQGFGSDFTLTEQISSVNVDVFIIKEFYGTAANGSFVLIKSLNIGDDLYQIESNGVVFKLSVAKQDQSNDTWQYIALAQTNTIQIPVDAIIDLDGEINNGNKVSLYFTGSGVEPRVLYVQLQDTWVENSAMLYDETFSTLENTTGYFTHNNIGQITKLQIIENWAIPSLISVNDNGGGLTTGSKMYTVRQSIGRENRTAFYYNSNPIPIFLKSLGDPTLYGNESGLISSKSITLNISGLNSTLYNFFELICVENNDGALSAYIVSQYEITGETQQVTHTGFEEKISITISELSEQQVIIKNSENLIILRNRLFLSNIILSEQPNLFEWAQTIPIVTKRTTLPAIGNLYSNVAEYQVPFNVNQKTGYMIEEIYRFGIVLMFNNKSKYRGATQPIFVGDHKINAAYNTIGTAIVNGISGSPYPAIEPTEIYIYYPEFQVDLSTVSIDGIPLSELVDSYYLVRQPCIPEVLASGHIMPANTDSEPDYYTCGYNASSVPASVYTEPSNSNKRRQCSFLYADGLFGLDINPLQGDIVLNYGQVIKYNNTLEFGLTGPVGEVQLNEFGTYDETIAPVQHIISGGELVNFNTQGVINIVGKKLRNTVVFPFPGGGRSLCGNNQKSLAIELGDFLNPLSSGLIDIAFYNALYIRRINNKYGAFTDGNYIFCGHSRKVEAGIHSYTESLFGGDTFNIKVFTKFNNYNVPDDNTAPASATAMGLSYYARCRGNYQLRNFTAGTDADYPYTSSTLAGWIGLDVNLPGQMNYSLSYTPTTLLFSQKGYNPNLPFVSAEPSTMRYSQLKLENSLLDSYRQFLPLDFKAFPSVHGAIKNTFSYGNAIFVMMDRFICIQQVDLQQQQTDPNNQISIIIGDGTVLGAREQELSFIGAPLKTAGYSYLSKFGKKYFVWFNPFYKKVIQYTAEGIRDLFDDNQMQSFLTKNTTYITQERQFFFCYDYYTSELLIFATSPLTGPIIYDAAETYTKGQIVFTEGGYTNTKYYIATQSVPMDSSPEDVGNLFRYWKPYRQSNFVISYNEQSNNIVSFYSYTPAYPLIPYLNTFLSSPTSLLLSQNVYEHNRHTNLFYQDNITGYVSAIINADKDVFKTAVNIQMESTLIPLSLVFTSNSGTLTYGEQSDIKLQRNLWWAVVKNDATINANNPTGLNSKMTSQISGEYIEAIVFFVNSEDQLNTLNSINMDVIRKPPIISNR